MNPINVGLSIAPEGFRDAKINKSSLQTRTSQSEVLAGKVTINQNTWSDFVFDKDYQLMTIDEIENFIAEHNHLPGVPSEADIIENGVDLGEMDRILLQKIEELTLYIIELKSEISEFKQDK
ncbi:MAG TPA: hypothetical protein P5509_05820 [Bacteroidales bacterium]|nr:hypothetical protein [Bacteroidales bacterium]